MQNDHSSPVDPEAPPATGDATRREVATWVANTVGNCMWIALFSGGVVLGFASVVTGDPVAEGAGLAFLVAFVSVAAYLSGTRGPR